MKKLLYIVMSFLVFSLLIPVACNKSTQEKNIIRVSGTIEAREVYIRTEVSGQIVQFDVEEGDDIKEGEIVCQQDHQKLDYQLAQAEGQVEEIRAKLALLRKGAREEEVERAQAALERAKSALDDAEREYKRNKQLVADKARPQATLDKAETALELNQKQYEMAQKEYEIIKLGSRKEEIVAAEARLKQANATLNLIKSQIEDATIISPRKGVLTEKLAEEGEFLPAGYLLAKLTDLDDIWMNVYLSEVDYGKVRLHDKVEVSIDSFPNRKFTGLITYLSPEAEFTPKNIQTEEERVKLVFAVRITIDNPQGYLKPGLPADADIILFQE